MQIGVILTYADGTPELPSRTQPDSESLAASLPLALLDVLGSNLLERTAAKLHSLSALPPVLLRDSSFTRRFSKRSTASEIHAPAGWEDAVAQFVNGGVETLCLIRGGTYTDLDFSDLLRFHLQGRSGVTQAYSRGGPLNVVMVAASRLRAFEGNYRKVLGGMMAEQDRFNYRGYTNSLNSIADYYRLAQDGLFGRCELSPAGAQVQDRVWIAEGAQLDSTVQISGPAFIGLGSCIRAGCTVRGGSSIERNCEIDYGSLVEESCILPNTYVGIALDVRRSVVKGSKLFHLDRNVELTISDERLVGMQPSPSSLLGIARKHQDEQSMNNLMIRGV